MRVTSLAIACAACQEYDVVPETFTEVFVQVDPEVRADVVVVVDDSPSMAEEQDRLLGTFGSLVDALGASEAEFHLGVTTTDTMSTEAGVFRGGWVAWDDQNLLETVRSALAVGTEGDRLEAGLDAALLALEPAGNTGFRRDGVPLHLLVISDEDDSSSGLVAALLDDLRAAAGEAVLGIHGIVGDLPAGCANGANAAAAAPRYTEAINQTEGDRASICSDDYGDLLERVGLKLAGLPTTFPLSAVPMVDTLEVYVDEVRMVERDVDGWSYDPGDNAVVFTGRAVPRPGMDVSMRYQELLGAAD